MAVQYDGGVVIGADSRTSTGAYIANRVSDKVTAIDERVYVCRSGSAADTQAVSDAVKAQLLHLRAESGGRRRCRRRRRSSATFATRTRTG